MQHEQQLRVLLATRSLRAEGASEQGLSQRHGPHPCLHAASQIRSSERLVKVCGTWAYAAPEMADAARPGYDTKFDTWGYGVILSVVLTG